MDREYSWRNALAVLAIFVLMASVMGLGGYGLMFWNGV